MSKFKIKKSKDGQYYWVLTAKNGEPLCCSEMYTTKQSAINGVESCKVNAPVAVVDDCSDDPS